MVTRFELTQLQNAFDQAATKHGNLALIHGEPGIGKSSLARSFSEQMRDMGALVVYGQCHETLGSPPFWPWLQILKVLDCRADIKSSRFADIFEKLASSEADKLQSKVSTFAEAVCTEQFVLFNQICSMLVGLAENNVLILVLDDLHWADRSSLLLLLHFCREFSTYPVLVIGTYRDTEVSRKHILSETLGEINRIIKIHRIELNGLSTQGVADFIKSKIKHGLPENLIQTLQAKTEGNPLFVSEVVNMLAHETNHFANERWALEIPNGITEAIGRRLNLLSDDCNELLSSASVIGRHFNLHTLNELYQDYDQMTILSLLEEAESKSILKVSSTNLGEYQYAHVLMRDILYSELSLTKRILLHAKVADILVEQRNISDDQSLGEIARHYCQAIQGGQSDKALKYSLLAAEHARSLFAFDEAKNYFQLALDTINTAATNQAAQKPQILLDIAMCLHALGTATEPNIEALDKCIAEARIHKNHTVFQEAACLRVYIGRLHHQYEKSLRIISEAVTYLDEIDLLVRANVLAHKAMALSFNLRRREAESVAYEAVKIAAESNDAFAHCSALCMALLVLRGRPEKLSERIRLGEQALQIARQSKNDYCIMDPLEWLILSYQESGEMKRTQELIFLLDSAVTHNHEFKARYLSASAKACLALFYGKWQQAESLIEDALKMGAGSLDGSAEGVYGAQMFFLNREQGRLPMIHEMLSKMTNEQSPMWKPGLLATYVDIGLFDEARMLFNELTADDFSAIANDELYLTCLVYLTEACIDMGESKHAIALYQRLLPYSGQMVAHPTAVCYGPADLYLGNL